MLQNQFIFIKSKKIVFKMKKFYLPVYLTLNKVNRFKLLH